MYGLDSHLGCPRLPDPDLAVKLGAYERIGELPGAARSAATGSERQAWFDLNEFRRHSGRLRMFRSAPGLSLVICRKLYESMIFATCLTVVYCILLTHNTQGRYFPGGLPNSRPLGKLGKLGKYFSLLFSSSQRQRHKQGGYLEGCRYGRQGKHGRQGRQGKRGKQGKQGRQGWQGKQGQHPGERQKCVHTEANLQ